MRTIRHPQSSINNETPFQRPDFSQSCCSQCNVNNVDSDKQEGNNLSQSPPKLERDCVEQNPVSCFDDSSRKEHNNQSTNPKHQPNLSIASVSLLCTHICYLINMLVKMLEGTISVTFGDSNLQKRDMMLLLLVLQSGWGVI